MEMSQISIDLDVYKEIQKRLQSFKDTPNQVLRRVFKLEAKEDQIPIPQEGDLHVAGIVLKNGLKLRKIHKGKEHEAVVRNGKIEFNEKQFPSPSGAAVAATGYPVNGWRFWQFFDQVSGTWKLLDTLRGN